jgi:hypothetical protein
MHLKPGPLQKNEIALNIFERKISRKIYGAIQENGIWRKRYNHELYNLYNDVESSKKAKISRMKSAGHVLRMNDEEPAKKLMLGKPDGTRRRGRPKLRWIDGLEKDLRNMNIKNWKNIALDRSRWRRCLEQAKTHPGLYRP